MKGWGELARHMTKALSPEAQIVAYELDKDSVKSMNETGITAKYGMLEEDTDAEPYDLVMSSHSTEHFREPRAVFEKIRPLLKPGGYLFIEVCMCISCVLLFLLLKFSMVWKG